MASNTANRTFPAPRHDHAACIEAAMARAQRVCAERGLRLTRLRQRVLELVWTNHKPSKAYDLLEAIRGEPFSAAPPTVYRALDFLQEAGLVHRIESLNAFLGCDADHGSARPVFMICRQCERVAEISSASIRRAIARTAAAAEFDLDQGVVELRGLCRGCGAA